MDVCVKWCNCRILENAIPFTKSSRTHKGRDEEKYNAGWPTICHRPSELRADPVASLGKKDRPHTRKRTAI